MFMSCTYEKVDLGSSSYQNGSEYTLRCRSLLPTIRIISLSFGVHTTSSFSSTTLCEFWLVQLFLSLLPLLHPLLPIVHSHLPQIIPHIVFPSSSNHSSHRLPILLLPFPSVLLHTVSICIWSWPLFH